MSNQEPPIWINEACIAISAFVAVGCYSAGLIWVGHINAAFAILNWLVYEQRTK